MASVKQVAQMAEKLLLPVAQEYGYILWHTEYKKEGGMYYLRAFFDKEGGIGIQDLELINPKCNEIIDNAELVSDAYIFEISSVGVSPVLVKKEHFEKFVGKKIEISLFKPINGCKNFVGELCEYNEDKLTILVDGNKMEIENSQIAKANGYDDFEK